MKKQRVVVQCTPLPAQGVPKTMKSVHQRITGDIADDLESIEDVFTLPNEGTPTKAEERKSFDEDLEAGLLASTVKASTEGHRGKLSVCLKMTDYEGEILRLLELIRENTKDGHSFDVIVDPHENGGTKFFIDGDGADFIYDIKVEELED